MKIALVSLNAWPPAWNDHGRNVAVQSLAEALARAGHAVCIFTRHGERDARALLSTIAGVCIEQLSDGGARAGDAQAPDAGERLSAQLAVRWQLDPPDVVHAHGWVAGKAALAATRRLGLPLVQTFDEPRSSEDVRSRQSSRRTGPRDAEEAALVRACDRIVARSSAEVFELLGLGASPGAIKLIPSGVDLERFRSAERTVRASGANFRIATLSAGAGDVVEALRYVRDVDAFVGSTGGPQFASDASLDELENLARSRGVASRVTVAGRIEPAATAAFLRSADAFVCAPWSDATGAVALAAMACGVPVIAAAVGALVDVVADGMTGIHVPPRAPRQIAYAVETLKSDPALCARLGRFGAERAAARYGWARIASETVGVYTSAAGRPTRAGQSRA